MIKPIVYEGNKPYIYICYSHIDRNIVYPIISFLFENNYRLWWDEGLSSGNWADQISEKILNCSVILCFIGSGSDSEYFQDEIYFALRHTKRK